MEDWPQIAARQFGLITRNQALAVGLSPDAIYRRVSSGKWREVLAGVYALRGAPRSWRQELLAGTLWAGEPSAASYGSAAALFGFPGFAEGTVEITSPRNLRPRRPGHLIHRRPLTKRDIATISGIPVTTPVRTICDLAAVTNSELLQEAIDFCRLRGLISFDRLLRAIDGPAKGRAGVSRLRQIAREIGHSPESVMERRFLRCLRRAGLREPIRQFPVGAHRIDFAYPGHMIAIEADGFEFHSDRTTFDSDRNKWNALVAGGWRILHVTWTDLNTGCVRVIAELEVLLSNSTQRVYPGPR